MLVAGIKIIEIMMIQVQVLLWPGFCYGGVSATGRACGICSTISTQKIRLQLQFGPGALLGHELIYC
jgi:hypothetical protein